MKYESFEPLLGEWAVYFKPFIESEKMDKIYSRLKEDSKKGRKICPDSHNVFTAFNTCSPKNLNTIWFLQD